MIYPDALTSAPWASKSQGKDVCAFGFVDFDNIEDVASALFQAINPFFERNVTAQRLNQGHDPP